MKTYFLLLTIFTGVFAPARLKAQACDLYYPAKAGTVLEMKHYDAKGKETGTSRTVIVSSREIPGGIEVTARNEFPPRKKVSRLTQMNTPFIASMVRQPLI